MDSLNLNEIHKFLLEIVPKCGDVCQLFMLACIPINLLFNFRLFEALFIKKNHIKRKVVLRILLQRPMKK